MLPNYKISSCICEDAIIS